VLVTALTNDDRHGRRALGVLAAVAVLLALCAVSVLAVPGPDSASAARAKLIGKAKGKARSGCPTPEDECQAVGRLTGFQARATGAKNPFVVRRSGTLVGWSVDLTSRPKPSQRRAFGKLYRHKRLGTTPTARIAILKKRRGKKYALKSQSPLVDLTDHLGERPIITLNNPLRIKKGDIVALTIPTWVSSFAVGVPARQNVWRASRAGNACEVGTSGVPKQNLKKSKPQEDEGSSRSYGCAYRGARLLYWGYYVPGS
jgi:hypothetical protein